MRRLLLLMMGLVLICTPILAQRTLAGKVQDDNGQPIIGASVIVKNTRVGTTTDSRGNFALTLPSNAKALIISAVGYSQQEVAIEIQQKERLTY